MVDFSKRLSGKKVEALIDPVKLYETLDRAHDKGPLRPSQAAVLTEWFQSRRDERDLIVKLHTGQGKTLIGLLVLQSRINEKKAPVYICVRIIFSLSKLASKPSNLASLPVQLSLNFLTNFMTARTFS